MERSVSRELSKIVLPNAATHKMRGVGRMGYCELIQCSTTRSQRGQSYVQSDLLAISQSLAGDPLLEWQRVRCASLLQTTRHVGAGLRKQYSSLHGIYADDGRVCDTSY